MRDAGNPGNATRASVGNTAQLPRLLEGHKLLGREPENRPAEDAWLNQLSKSIFKSTPEQTADAAAAALAEGFAPAGVGEAVTLAANQLVLRDMGRMPKDEVTGKPIGSVHGDSIGVHALVGLARVTASEYGRPAAGAAEARSLLNV